MRCTGIKIWCSITESNRVHPAYKAGVHPYELIELNWREGMDSNHDKQVNSLP